MNVSKCVLFALIFIGANTLIAQGIFVPAEMQMAYENNTRSYDGKPGPNYWQNSSDYQISVEVDPVARMISGSSAIEYFNNSPDALSEILIRLYSNVSKAGAARDERISETEITDGVQISKCTLNGGEIDLDSRGTARLRGTNLYIFLPEPLEPGQSMNLTFDWEQEISNADGRQGYIDSTSAFIAYWYPQVAVYDDIFGWDNLQYTYQSEFYNDLANFDVSITLPPDYTVWATGELKNASDVLQAEQFDLFNKALNSEMTVDILTLDDINSGYTHKSGTWEYEAKNVTDFAFGFSSTFAWSAAICKVEDRNVLVNAGFPADQPDRYTSVVDLHTGAMKHLSEDIPGVPYPYPTYSAFMGLRGGGMEFPMMANNNGPGIRVSIHEMFHTYFPMYVRVNERRHAWMDEGWADFMDALVAYRFFGDNAEPVNAEFSGRIDGGIGTWSDLPLITQTRYMDWSNYGYASYPLPAMVYWLLLDHLGDEVFFNCLRTYINDWAMKAPSPYDFFNTFERVSGQDLDWFWNPWFFQFGHPEVGVLSGNGKKIEVQSTGIKPVPVKVECHYNDGTTASLEADMNVWKKGSTHKFKVPNGKELRYAIVNKNIPDFDRTNNIFPSIGEIYQGQDFSALTGTYLFERYRLNVYLQERDGGLELIIPRQGTQVYLLPKEDGTYITSEGSYEIEMQSDDEGTKGMLIRSGSNEFDFVKVQ